MKLFILSTALLFSLPTQASKLNPETYASCAKMALSSIYTAERSFESEYKRFDDDFHSIGYDPEHADCARNMDISIRLFNGAKEFLAQVRYKHTGETWTINQRKELLKSRD